MDPKPGMPSGRMEMAVVELDISKADAVSLREILESALADLRYEINNTDSYDFKEKLRERQSLLERVIGQL
jgi:hypothetical protein